MLVDARRYRFATAVVLTAALNEGTARADDAKSQAARSFEAGTEAYAHKDFRDAARAFEEAYHLVPRGAAAYNAGLARESAGDRSRAADDYTQALEASDLGAAERADATGRLRALEQKLGRLTLSWSTGASVTLDDADLAGTSADVHVDPGKHELRVTYEDGRSESRSILVRAGGEQVLKLAQVQVAEEPPAPPPPHEGTRDGDHVEEPRTPPRHDDHAAPSPDRLPAWVAFGGAVVASGAAIALYAEGVSARNAFVAGGSTDGELRGEALNLRTATWVAWSLAGAFAVTGLVLYLDPPGGKPPASSRSAVSFDGRAITVHLRF